MLSEEASRTSEPFCIVYSSSRARIEGNVLRVH